MESARLNHAIGGLWIGGDQLIEMSRRFSDLRPFAYSGRFGLFTTGVGDACTRGLAAVG